MGLNRYIRPENCKLKYGQSKKKKAGIRQQLLSKIRIHMGFGLGKYDPVGFDQASFVANTRPRGLSLAHGSLQE